MNVLALIKKKALKIETLRRNQGLCYRGITYKSKQS